jgi:hypothetical protein
LVTVEAFASAMAPSNISAPPCERAPIHRGQILCAKSAEQGYAVETLG